MKRSHPSALVLAMLVAVLPACDGTRTAGSAPVIPGPTSDLSFQQAPTRAARSASAAAFPAGETAGNDGESEEGPSIPKPPPLTPLGVPECDTFIEKFVACVDLHVPADQKERQMRELHTYRVRWLELEKMQEGKIAARLSCRGVSERLKSDLIVDYGCDF